MAAMTGRLGALLLVALGALAGSSVPVSAHAPADAMVAATARATVSAISRCRGDVCLMVLPEPSSR